MEFWSSLTLRPFEKNIQKFRIKSSKNSKISNIIDIEIPKNKDKAPPRALMNSKPPI